MTSLHRSLFCALVMILSLACSRTLSTSKISDDNGASSIIKLLIPANHANVKYFLISAPKGATDAKFCEYTNNQCSNQETNLAVGNPIGDRPVFKGNVALSPTMSYRVSLTSQGQTVSRILNFGGAQSQNNPPQQNGSSNLDANLNFSLNKSVNNQLTPTSMSEVAGNAKFLMLDFSSSTCGFCIQFEKTIAREQSNFTSGVCKPITIVSNNDLQSWIRAAGVSSAAHSYELSKDSKQDLSSAYKAFIGKDLAGTPGIIVWDVQNKKVYNDSPGAPPTLQGLLPADCQQ